MVHGPAPTARGGPPPQRLPPRQPQMPARTAQGAPLGPEAWQAIAALQSDVASLRKAAPRWRRAFWAMCAVALLASLGAFAAISGNSHSYNGLAGDTFAYDETKFTVTAKGMFTAAAGVAATGSPAEIAIAVGGVYTSVSTTAITAGHWYYQVDLFEVGVASVTSGTYTAELFQDGVSMGTVQFTQGTSVGATVEGVSLRWSLGASSLTGTASYVVRVA